MELVSRLTRPAAATETSHAMTSAPDRMFFALTMSAWSKYPHSSHRNMRWLKTSFLLAADFERAQNDTEPQYLVSPAALATNLPTEPADPSNKYANDVFSGSRACVGRPRASGV